MLITVSLFFAVECKDLLVGEGLIKRDIDKITTILSNEKNITAYKRPLSLYFGPQEVLLNLDVHFVDELTSDEIEVTIDRIEANIKKALPRVNRIFIEAETIKKATKKVTKPIRNDDSEVTD